MRIAILDDDANERNLACQVLNAAGYSCAPFCSAQEFLGALDKAGIDMLVMNWQMSGQGSSEVLRQVRATMPPAFPVLFLTGRASEEDIMAALDAGANDYLVKPVRRGELVIRVRTLLRRSYPEHAGEQLRIGQYLFEVRTGKMNIAGCQVDLTQKEFELALLFFRHLDRPLSRAYILETIWPGASDVPSRTMDTHVSRIRNKLQLRPENGFRLVPVYSYGYRLELLAE